MVRPSSLLDTRIIYCGDCLDQLPKLPAQSVDLIYIDPPFNSNRNYEVFWGETREKRSFEDRHASTQAYLEFMQPRCVELSRILKATGSFYFHCDWHASHYVKVMLDRIFGEDNFQNEIVWKRHYAHNDPERWGRIHDVLLFYAGPDGHTWNPVHQAYDPRYLDDKYRFTDARGRYRLVVLTAPGTTEGDSCKPWRGIDPKLKGRHWSVPRAHIAALTKEDLTIQEKLDLLDKNGFIYWPKGGKGVPEFKQYLGEGVPIQDDIDDIPPINSQAEERLGYPTQKPLALLERIVRASSNENDIVLDAFCGCGTALEAAERLKRQWIGIDISPTACQVMAKRLRNTCKLPENEKLWHVGRGFVVRDLPWTEEQLRKIPPFEFENWAVIALGGRGNRAKVGDMGIDGRIFPVSAVEHRRGVAQRRVAEAGADELSFMDVWFPIQVKQKDKVGRPDIDSFEAVMMREDRTKGFFVSFDYSSDALHEIRAFFQRTGKSIKALRVRDILDDNITEMLV